MVHSPSSGLAPDHGSIAIELTGSVLITAGRKFLHIRTHHRSINVAYRRG